MSEEKMKKKPKQHPWEIWLAEEYLTLIQGEHFSCAPYIMAQQFRNKALKYTRDGKDLKIGVSIAENVLRLHIEEVE
jgi:hypothetical protein